MTALRLLQRELRDSLRNYWFAVSSGVLVVGGLLLMLFGQPNQAILGYRGFARALAGLMQLALFVVPLLALFPAVSALAGERELGTLDYLLAQPVTRDEVFAGKWTGVGAAVSLAVLAGFGATGLVAVVRGVPPGMVAVLLGFTLLLGVCFVSLGIWISSLLSTRARATSAGLTVWLFFLAMGSLGLASAFVGWGVPAPALEVWAFVNPVEAYRLASIAVLDPGVSVLGPVGAGLLDRFGRGPLIGLALASLAAWTGLGYWAGRRAFAAPIR